MADTIMRADAQHEAKLARAAKLQRDLEKAREAQKRGK